MSDYVEYNVTSRVAWLRRQAGDAYLGVLGVMKQAFLEAMHVAARMADPRTAPLDALPYIAEDRGQEAGFEGEGSGAIRFRLMKAFVLARGRGWYSGITNELARIGYPNTHIEDAISNPALSWWEWRVVLERPFPFDDQSLADNLWTADGGEGTWDDGGVWATAMPETHLRHLRALLRKKATHSRCVGIHVIYDANDPDAFADLDP